MRSPRYQQPRGIPTDDDLYHDRPPLTATPPSDGKRKKLQRKRSETKMKEQPGWEIPAQEHRGLGSLLREEGLLDDMPPPSSSRPRLQLWPDVQGQAGPLTPANHLLRKVETYQPQGRPGIPDRKASANAVHEYYDPSGQSVYVSQQTSESAVRDRSLRKGSPITIHESSSDPTLARRPLKSAMKKPTEDWRKAPEDFLGMRVNVTERTHDKEKRGGKEKKEKKQRKLDLSHFFPRPSKGADHHLFSHNNKLSSSPSAMTDTSDSFWQQRRPSPHARFDEYTKSSSSLHSASTVRAKIFDPDIFDQSKTHVRRPPKGIQNWFDGFDISSDEDEKKEPVELPADEKLLGGHALPSTFSPWVKPDAEQPQLDRRMSQFSINLRAIQQAKERMQERLRLVDTHEDSADTITLGSAMSDVPSKKPPSRLAISRLANESVLSLSDSESDDQNQMPPIRDSVDDSSITIGRASTLNFEKLSAQSRRVQNFRSTPRDGLSRVQSASTVRSNQTSGSIPIRLTGSIPVPPPHLHSPPLPESQNSSSHATYQAAQGQALQKLEGRLDVDMLNLRSRPTTTASSQDYETVISGETATSLPLTEGSQLMAVTEEEMMLLEMMRQKRAMMTKSSFTEGYQLALKREQEQLVKRRESAQQAALQFLRAKEEKMRSRSGSINDSTVEETQRRKYSAIRKEDVDKALKLERFLAAADAAPLEDNFPEPPRPGGVTLPPEEQKHRPQKFELLLPATYSPAPGRSRKASPSPDGSSACPGDDDIEDHQRKIRQFLANNSASESPSTFPTPPSAKSKADSWREKRISMAMLSPSPVAEEEPIPDVPAPTANKAGPAVTEDRRGRTPTGRLDAEQLGQSSKTVPSPHAPPSGGHNPYHLSPKFEFEALDFPIAQLSTSPSLSTSKASPLTPTFTSNGPPSDKHTLEGAGSSSDNERSVRGRAYTPDTDLTSVSAATPNHRKPHVGGGGGGALKKAPPPPRLDMMAADSGVDPRGSVTSFTSAGEDVLAAWAALGGGGEARATRKRGR